jgi:hypothetical protein
MELLQYHPNVGRGFWDPFEGIKNTVLNLRSFPKNIPFIEAKKRYSIIFHLLNLFNE